MIVTIDGPAGAGKSSAAKMLAQRLGFEFLDTGAMYRAVTLAGLRKHIDFHDEQQLVSLVESITLEMPPGRVVLNGEDITGLIRTPEVTACSAPVANSPAVRHRLSEMQRHIAIGRNIVCEGRDQGTIVFPHAECKFFLEAQPEERARRRYEELVARGQPATYEETLAAQEARDARDAARSIAPMKPAADAIRIDSTGLSLDDVVQRLETEARRRMPEDHS